MQANEVAKQLQPEEHFEIDIKDRTVSLTDSGVDKICDVLGIENLYDPDHMHLPHFIDNTCVRITYSPAIRNIWWRVTVPNRR